MAEKLKMLEGGLSDLEKAARRIATDGLYGLILDTMAQDEGAEELNTVQIKKLLIQNSDYLDEYRRVNNNHGISNIDVSPLLVRPSDDADRKNLFEKINANILELGQLEPYASKASALGYGMWVGSAVVLLIFALHNVFAMFTQGYRDYPALIYGLYAALCLAGIFINSWFVKRHSQRHRNFEQLKAVTNALLERAITEGHIEKHQIFKAHDNAQKHTHAEGSHPA